MGLTSLEYAYVWFTITLIGWSAVIKINVYAVPGPPPFLPTNGLFIMKIDKALTSALHFILIRFKNARVSTATENLHIIKPLFIIFNVRCECELLYIFWLNEYLFVGRYMYIYVSLKTIPQNEVAILVLCTIYALMFA